MSLSVTHVSLGLYPFASKKYLSYLSFMRELLATGEKDTTWWLVTKVFQQFAYFDIKTSRLNWQVYVYLMVARHPDPWRHLPSFQERPGTNLRRLKALCFWLISSSKTRTSMDTSDSFIILQEVASQAPAGQERAPRNTHHTHQECW